MPPLTLSVLDPTLAVRRFSPDTPLPAQLLEEPLFFVARTADELSVVCRADLKLEGGRVDRGWSAIQVAGPLDFSLTGILANIARVLAGAQISIFAISTFDTDYVLVKCDRLTKAQTVLREAGYRFLADET
jgi:hypothetical protein